MTGERKRRTLLTRVVSACITRSTAHVTWYPGERLSACMAECIDDASDRLVPMSLTTESAERSVSGMRDEAAPISE